MLKNLIAAITLSSSLSGVALAADKFHCEGMKDGKAVDIKDAKNRKECNAKGGKWVKEEGHGHGHGSEEKDHDHNEDGKNEETK
jgi:hypothetical protein